MNLLRSENIFKFLFFFLQAFNLSESQPTPPESSKSELALIDNNNQYIAVSTTTTTTALTPANKTIIDLKNNSSTNSQHQNQSAAFKTLNNLNEINTSIGDIIRLLKSSSSSGSGSTHSNKLDALKYEIDKTMQ